jgi:hypothetical protein
MLSLQPLYYKANKKTSTPPLTNRSGGNYQNGIDLRITKQAEHPRKDALPVLLFR